MTIIREEPTVRFLARRAVAERRYAPTMGVEPFKPTRTPVGHPAPSWVDDLTRLPDWWRVRYIGKDELSSDWQASTDDRSAYVTQREHVDTAI